MPEPDPAAGFVPFAVTVRGGPERVETAHLGALAVLAGDGREVLALGDVGRALPLRSTAKPFQLLALLLDGLERSPAQLAPLEDADLAVLMASHSGEPRHTERVAALLERYRLSAGELRCGAHPPFDRDTRHALIARGESPTALHCNCSGKHTAMLAVCRARGWPLETYLDPGHPLQQRIEALLCTLAGQPRPLPRSIDGCSLPTWWLPLRALALLFARLAWPAGAPELEGRSAAAPLARLYRAAVAHPGLIAGRGRLDTRLMAACAGRVMAKTGAAGMYAMAVAPSAAYPRGLGIAFKILDGDPDSSVREVVAASVLERLGEAGEGIAAMTSRVLRNHRGLEVGRLEALAALGRG